MATNNEPEADRVDGYLVRLPNGHQQIFDQNIRRVVRAINAVFRKQDVGLDELVLVVVASMRGEIGRGLASMLATEDEIRREFRLASAEEREPTLVTALADNGSDDQATDFVQTVLPEAIPYLGQRSAGHGEIVLIIFDADDRPTASIIRPLSVGTKRFVS